MKPATKIAIVAGGYEFALLAGWAAVEWHARFTDVDSDQASSGMAAFGDLILFAAVAGGINLIDTAAYYGKTRSESLLGLALKGVPRDRYLMATKCGRYDDAVFDISAERVTRSVEQSLQLLGLDTIDIFQVHDIEFGSPAQVVEETLPALEKIRAAGKIRYLGVTGLPLKIFQYVIPRYPIDTIISYSRYTLIDQALTDLFPLLDEHGIGPHLHAEVPAAGAIGRHPGRLATRLSGEPGIQHVGQERLIFNYDDADHWTVNRAHHALPIGCNAITHRHSPETLEGAILTVS